MNSSKPSKRGFLVFVTSLLLLSSVQSVLCNESNSSLSGHWEGAVQLPNGELNVMVDLTSTSDKGWTGTIDIPQQGATGLTLFDFDISESGIRFSIQGVPGEPTFDGQLVGAEITGKFKQGSAELDFKLGRQKVSSPVRPQEPKAPYPYKSEEVTFANGDIILAGTLTLPDGNGPYPTAVLITGSGSQDRNETVVGHKPFLVLADHLTRAGIAVLRYDDRGVGGSTGSVPNSTSADFAEDVMAAVEFLEGRPEIAADRIGLIGHSEGGMVAPIAADMGADVSYMVLLAGPGVSLTTLLPKQTEQIGLADGMAPEMAAQQAALIGEAMKVFATDLSRDEIREIFLDIARRQIALQDTGEEEMTDQMITKEVNRQVDQMLTPWFRYAATYEPGPVLNRINMPVLAVNGELDTQVDFKQNLDGLRTHMAHNKDLTTVSMPGLNHLFQHCETGSPSEYAKIEETMAPEVLNLVSQWIMDQFGSSSGSTN